jgi:Arc/MetJ-type ribon-helix-helix transcriptional regulator
VPTRSRRPPKRIALSFRLPKRLSAFIDRVSEEDDRFYNRSHLIEEACLAFQSKIRDGADLQLVDDATRADD